MASQGLKYPFHLNQKTFKKIATIPFNFDLLLAWPESKSEYDRPLIVGIAGPTRAGKTSLARALQEKFSSPDFLTVEHFILPEPHELPKAIVSGNEVVNWVHHVFIFRIHGE